MNNLIATTSLILISFLMATVDISWYMKYIGLPITVGVTMVGLSKYLSGGKRRSLLQNKVVVITGASSGIGEALAHSFYKDGSQLVLAARRIKELNRVKEDLMSKKLEHPTKEPIVLELDLANIDSFNDFVEIVLSKCGTIDILINNGGISHRASVLETAVDVYEKIMKVNYIGSVALTKAFLPEMVKKQSGHIVFISSVQGLIAIPDRSAYAASKHAMQAFGDSLRAEMHQHKIDVTVISPGYVQTNISLNALTGSGATHGVMDKSTAEGFAAEYAAEKMVDAIVAKKKEFVISQFLPEIAIFLRHFAPSLYFHFMTKRANRTTA